MGGLENGCTTVMSVLRGVAHDSPDHRRRTLERFAQQYTVPLIGYLCRCKRLEPDAASELVQEFWLRKLIEPSPESNLVARYLESVQEVPSERSFPFRAYLLRAVGNYVIDAARRNRNPVQPLDTAVLAAFEASGEAEQWTFDVAWANSVLRSVVDEVREECRAKGQETMWRLFCQHIVLPGLTGHAPPGYAQLAEEYGLPDARGAANAVRTVLRKFQSHMKQAVCGYLSHADLESSRGAEVEVEEVLAILSRPNALELEMFSDIVAEFGAAESLSASGPNPPASESSRSWRLPSADDSLFHSSNDYRSCWSDLMSASVPQWLAATDPPTLPASSPTFRDLVRGAPCSLDVLTAVRNGSKQRAARMDGEPREILSAIHHIAIVVAHQQHRRLLTADSPRKLRERIQVLLDFSWLDADTRSLFASAVETICD